MTQNKSSGFTLIELVVVIVILGILAVTAAPRFMNLAPNANEAALKGLYSSIKSAAELTYSKSLIDGTENEASSTISLGNGDVKTAYGYPTGQTGGMLAALDLGVVNSYGEKAKNSESDWVYQGFNLGNSRVGFEISLGHYIGDGPGAPNPKNTGCFVAYYPAIETEPYLLSITTTNCASND